MTHYMDLPFGEGEVIKNYKEMCARLGEKERGGDSKNSQMRRWREHFDWVKKGHKFVITEVFDDNFPTDDENPKSWGKEYNETLEKLILNTLHWVGEKKEDYKTYLTVTSMINLTKIVDPNFMPAFREEGSFSYKEIGKSIQEDQEFVEVFMNRVYDTLRYDFRRVLQRLENKRLVHYERVIMVKPTTLFAHEDIDFDDKQLLGVGHNQKTLKEMKYYYQNLETLINGTENRDEYYRKKMELTTIRPALEFEKVVVSHVENLVLEAMGFEELSGIFAQKKQKIYYSNVSKLLQKAIGVDYAYRGYAVYFSPVIMKRLHLEKEELFKLEKGQRAELEKLLNEQFNNSLQQNFERFQSKARLKLTEYQTKGYIPEEDAINTLKRNKLITTNEAIVLKAKNYNSSINTLTKKYVVLNK